MSRFWIHLLNLRWFDANVRLNREFELTNACYYGLDYYSAATWCRISKLTYDFSKPLEYYLRRQGANDLNYSFQLGLATGLHIKRPVFNSTSRKLAFECIFLLGLHYD